MLLYSYKESFEVHCSFYRTLYLQAILGPLIAQRNYKYLRQVNVWCFHILPSKLLGVLVTGNVITSEKSSSLELPGETIFVQSGAKSGRFALNNFFALTLTIDGLGGVVKEHRCEKSTALNSNLGPGSNKQSSNKRLKRGKGLHLLHHNVETLQSLCCYLLSTFHKLRA